MPTPVAAVRRAVCAYASHGDTKHVLKWSHDDPYECFTMSAQAFDLADLCRPRSSFLRDLDIGMNSALRAARMDDSRVYDPRSDHDL